MISALTSPLVFACHCQPEPDGIEVGILAMNDDFEAGWHTLYNADREGESFQLYIPILANPSYNVMLTYGHPIQNAE